MNEAIETTAVTVPAASPVLENHGGALALAQEMSIEQVVHRVEKVRELQKRVMKDNIHYGVIPGTPKPTLLKPGAELLLLTFMLDPQYEHTIVQNGDHREITSRCVLYHIPTGARVASGEGSCSTYESKYAYRKATPKCLSCGKELRRSATEWYCWRKQGGCGATFDLKNPNIKGGGRVPNPDLADQYNTVLKMANKRSLIAACLNATAASEIFTQDVEDFENGDDHGSPEPGPEPKAEHRPEARPEVKPEPHPEAKPEPTQERDLNEVRAGSIAHPEQVASSAGSRSTAATKANFEPTAQGEPPKVEPSKAEPPKTEAPKLRAVPDKPAPPPATPADTKPAPKATSEPTTAPIAQIDPRVRENYMRQAYQMARSKGLIVGGTEAKKFADSDATQFMVWLADPANGDCGEVPNLEGSSTIAAVKEMMERVPTMKHFGDLLKKLRAMPAVATAEV